MNCPEDQITFLSDPGKHLLYTSQDKSLRYKFMQNKEKVNLNALKLFYTREYSFDEKIGV